MTVHQVIEDASDPLNVATDPFEATIRTIPAIENQELTVESGYTAISILLEQNETDQWTTEEIYKRFDDLNDTSLHQNDTFTLSPDIICTLSGGPDVTYALEPVISWVSIDSEGKNWLA